MADLHPYKVTLRHEISSGGRGAETETVSAVNLREAVYECLEHHPEVAQWRTLDIQVRHIVSLADSAATV